MLNVLRRVAALEFIKRAAIALFLLSTAFAIFFWRLGSLTPGLSKAEALARLDSNSLTEILKNPIGAPQKLLEYLFQQVGHGGIFWLRLSSVIFGMLFIFCFYIICRRWFGRFIAFFSTLLFISIPWVILLSRTATPDILFFSPLALIANYVWLSRTEHKNLALILLSLVTGMVLYTPGSLWLVLLIIILWRDKLLDEVDEVDTSAKITSSALIGLLLIPLAAAVASDWTLVKPLLLIPDDIAGVVTTIKSILSALLSLFLKSNSHTPILLDRLSILNATNFVLAVFGVYIMWQRARTEMYGLLALIILGIIGAGLDDNLMVLSLAIPSVGVFMAAGLRYLYGEWKNVFPFNPLPRFLAIALIIILVGLNFAVGIRYSLFAWPKTSATKNTYVLQ